MKVLKLALFFSFLFHITVLQYKIPKPKPIKPKAPQAKIKIKLKQELKKKPKKGANEKTDELYALSKMISKIASEMEKELKEANFVEQLLKKKCTKHYRGIGISYDGFLYDKITKVGQNTPAEKAGLRVGDHIVGKPAIRNIYPLGTTITLQILRNGIIMYMNVTIGKICTN